MQTAFIIEAFKSLEQDPHTVLLHAMYLEQIRTAGGSIVDHPLAASLPSPNISGWTVALWAHALVLTLGTALLILYAKQSLDAIAYNDHGGNPREIAHRRQLRYVL